VLEKLLVNSSRTFNNKFNVPIVLFSLALVNTIEQEKWRNIKVEFKNVYVTYIL